MADKKTSLEDWKNIDYSYQGDGSEKPKDFIVQPPVVQGTKVLTEAEKKVINVPQKQTYLDADEIGRLTAQPIKPGTIPN